MRWSPGWIAWIVTAATSSIVATASAINWADNKFVSKASLDQALADERRFRDEQLRVIADDIHQMKRSLCHIEERDTCD